MSSCSLQAGLTPAHLLQLLRRIVDKIIEDPAEPKWRRIKAHKIQSSVLDVQGGRDALVAVSLCPALLSRGVAACADSALRL